jgi:hypothetical protein
LYNNNIMKLISLISVVFALSLTLQACGQGSSNSGNPGGNNPTGTSGGSGNSGGANLSASKMSMQSPNADIKIGECSLVANVSFLTSSGVQAPISEELPVNISLSGNSFNLFSDVNCQSSLNESNYTLNQGTNSFALYAKPTALGAFAIHVENNLGTAQVQSAVVVGNVNQIGLNLGSHEIGLGACSGPYTIHTADNFGDLVSGTLVFSTETNLAVFSDSNCSHIISELVTNSTNGQGSFYLEGFVVGTGVLDINGTNGSTASASANIQIVN